MLDPSLIKTKTLERAAKEVSKAKVKSHNESLIIWHTALYFIKGAMSRLNGLKNLA